MRVRRMVAALALTIGATSGAQAGILFDPDGPTGPLAPIDLGQMGWSTTSAVAVGGNAAVTNWTNSQGACPANTCLFEVITHARLVDTTDQAGAVNTPVGLNTSFEITMVARFQEVVTGVGFLGPLGIASFATTGVGLLQIYHHGVRNSDDLTGHGFNDGTLIVQGTLVQPNSVGFFAVTDPGALQFDQFPGGRPVPAVDNYGDGSCPALGTSQCSVAGTGSQHSLAVDALTQDFGFFLTQLDTFGVGFANISQQLPFQQAQPSDCFTPATPGVVGVATVGPQPCAPIHVDGPYALQGLDPLGGYVPNTGAINGLFGGGPDFVFQTRYTATVSPAQVVPEPGGLALLGLGLVAFGMVSLRRGPRGRSAMS